jgi:hypothetical protein
VSSGSESQGQERPAQKAIRLLFRWMPLIFGIGFIAPLIAQTMAAWGWNAPFGLTRSELGLMIGAPWGIYAVLVGRWL